MSIRYKATNTINAKTADHIVRCNKPIKILSRQKNIPIKRTIKPIATLYCRLASRMPTALMTAYAAAKAPATIRNKYAMPRPVKGILGLSAIQFLHLVIWKLFQPCPNIDVLQKRSDRRRVFFGQRRGADHSLRLQASHFPGF